MNPRVVLYTYDFEPITVVTLPPVALSYLQAHHNVNVHVPAPVRFARPDEPIWDEMRLHIVHIHAEVLVRNGRQHLMLFTRDETAAMQLRADFLPGQRKEVHEAEREQYCRGFMDALTLACGGAP